MFQRSLGRTGLKVSGLSFGSWVTFDAQMGVEAVQRSMAAAFDGGCTFFDNAEAYAEGRAETLMGEALRRLGWRRSSYVVSTKLFWGGPGANERGLSRKHVVEGTIASLQRLGLDHVDVLFCHRADVHTPIEETVRAMNHVIDRGLVLYWGTSEWSADQIREAWRVADRLGLVGPCVEQPQYHLFHRERVEQEYAPLIRDVGLGTTVWSPLASGLLTGKYNDGVPAGSRLALPQYEWLRKAITEDPGFPAKVDKVRRLTALASDLGGTMAQLALAWCASNPHVSTVITGASRPEQVTENFKAVDLVPKLTPEVLGQIEAIVGNRPAAERDWRTL